MPVPRNKLRRGNIKKLKIYPEQELGRGTEGTVFRGRIDIEREDGSRKRHPVAVKVFKPAKSPNKVTVKKHRRMIAKLEKAGVKMPKMDYVYQEGRYVLVMEGFMRGKQSKMMKNTDARKILYNLRLPMDRGVIDAITSNFAKIISTGHSIAVDSPNLVFTSAGSLVYFQDIGSLYRFTSKSERNKAVKFFMTKFRKMIKDEQARNYFLERFNSELKKRGISL